MTDLRKPNIEGFQETISFLKTVRCLKISSGKLKLLLLFEYCCFHHTSLHKSTKTTFIVYFQGC